MVISNLLNVSSPKDTATVVGTKGTLLTLDIVNILFQSFCSYLLLVIYRRGTRTSCNQLFLLNLAFSEVYANIVLSVRDVFNLCIDLCDDKDIVRKIFWCINIYFVTGVCYIYISAMFYITGDRLFHILLHFTYNAHWSVEKTIKLIACTWLVNVVLSLTMSLFTFFYFHYVKHEIKLSKILSVYVLSVFYGLFLVFAVATYACMFFKYATSRRESMMSAPSQLRVLNRPPRKHSNMRRKSFTLFNLFIRSKFLVSVVLILTYLILTVIPTLVRTVFYLAGYRLPYSFSFWYFVSTRISDTLDGIIYTFLQKRVRHLLKQKCQFGGCVGIQTSPTRQLSLSRISNHDAGVINTVCQTRF